MSDGPVYVWWAKRSQVFHFRETCGQRHHWDHRESALAGMTPLTLLLCVLAGAVGWLVLFFGIWWLVAHIGEML